MYVWAAPTSTGAPATPNSSAGLSRNKRALREQERAIQGLQRSLTRFNAAARQTTRLLGVGFAVAVGAAVRATANLQQTLAQVRGITQATERQFARLTAQSLLLGRTTRFTARQVAEGQLFLARAGLEVGEIIAALPGTLSLAQATAVDVGQAADIVTNSLAAFRAGADETARFVDVLAKATVSANTDLIQFADGVKLVAPIAAALGVSVETVAAAIGVLSDAGLQATLAGTGLRRVLFDLQTPAGRTAEVFSDLGLAAEQLSVQQHGLIAVLETLQEVGISADQALVAFGKLGAPAFFNLSSALPRLKELQQELRESSGTATELQRVMDDTLQGAFFRLISAAEGVGIAFVSSGLGESIRGTIDDLAAGLNNLTDNLQNTLSAVGDTVVIVGTLLAGRFVAQTIAAVAALESFTAATIAARLGLAALSGPVGWIVIAAAALGFFLLRLESARDATTALAREVEKLLETQPQDTVSVLEHSIRRYERQIQQFRERLERPISLRLSLEVRGLIGQHEEELESLRDRLVEAQQAAVPGEPDPTTPQPRAVTRRRRDVGSDIRAGIERQARAARQRIDLLRAEGAERLKLEARFEIANRLVDEQIKLSAALVTAQGAARESLLAEQAALDRSVRSIDSLIEAKREQLEIDQRAVGLAAFQRALAESEAARPVASEVAGRIPGLSDLLEAEDETARFLAGVSADLESRAARVQARLNVLAGADEASEQIRLQFRERELALQQQLLSLRRESASATGEARIEAQEAAAGVQHQIDLLREQTGEVEEIAVRWRQVQDAERQANLLASRHVDIARVAVDALADGLANAAAHARSLGDALRSIALTITGSLLRTFLPGLISGAFGGASGSSTTLDFPFVSRQAGGPLAAGQSALVGENGPEIFRPRVGGDIIPSGVGGVAVNIGPINIESSDGPGVRAALGDLIPVLIDEVTQGVRQTLRVDSRRPSPA